MAKTGMTSLNATKAQLNGYIDSVNKDVKNGKQLDDDVKQIMAGWLMNVDIIDYIQANRIESPEDANKVAQIMCAEWVLKNDFAK